ncbi:hypothetical protein GGI26_005351 [Coemansia sp. RSA 1358]|uniref:Uncharacterized protein n=1 Tax=Coemansia umbellata TaxID=1424467 RepID=A0ABQ8PGP2_9FUNG|nr:hypothetical protein EDC05_004996 [Coemansia umbellata]KAJ2620002.1 hypothetical protein GGI26_005351 [Coemansia sp. RSA 1358]
MAFSKFFSKSNKKTKMSRVAISSSANPTPRTSAEFTHGYNNPMEVFDRLQQTNTAWAQVMLMHTRRIENH